MKWVHILESYTLVHSFVQVSYHNHLSFPNLCFRSADISLLFILLLSDKVSKFKSWFASSYVSSSFLLILVHTSHFIAVTTVESGKKALEVLGMEEEKLDKPTVKVSFLL